MNDLSGNKYVLARKNRCRDFSLNGFLFGDYIIGKNVDYNKLSWAVRSLLATLHFGIFLSGYNYLARLVERYIIKSDYDEDASIAYLADLYAVDERYICVNIAECISLNKKFLPTAAYLLDMPLTADDCLSIGDAVEIIGALFALYYGFTVANESCCDSDDKAINYNRLFEYGK